MARRTIGYFPERLSIGSSQLQPRAHESECVKSLTYDPDREQMTVEFWKRGTYTYFDVPPYVMAEFNYAASRGTYFNLYIRNSGFSYERVA